MRASAARAARRAVASSGAYSTSRTATPMCSSAYWRRSSCAGAGRAPSAAMRANETWRRVLMATNLTLAPLLAAWAGPARGQAAARLVPYRDSIPPTLVTFEMVPAPDRGFGHHGYPALAMTYGAARAYCAWLSARTGRHYGLPTDAQWTRALGLGLSTDTSLSAERRDALAWHAGNAAHQSHAVATKQADALGAYDLLGNVAEWVTVPDGPPVVRGGSWADPAVRVGPSTRAAQTPAWNETDPQFPKSRWWLADAPFVGFRIVLLTP